jgi:Fic family protein
MVLKFDKASNKASSPSVKIPVGYLWLAKHFNLQAIPPPQQSFIVEKGRRHTVEAPRQVTEYYLKSYWPGDTVFDHIEFALKHEGTYLPYLRAILLELNPKEVTEFIRSKPTGAYARRIWYMFEGFRKERLDLPDIKVGNYVELVDSQRYYTSRPIHSPRHRVTMNLPGTLAFSPMIHRSKRLAQWEARRLDEEAREIVANVPPEILDRALRYLYARETKSSFEIEREPLGQTRQKRFIELLRDVPKRDFLNREALVELQGRIVDPRFANAGYRDSINEQNYVGTTQSPGDEQIHFIPPKPGDISDLMNEFLIASQRMLESEIHPVIVAAAIAYPFVFLHPFSDGNGRLHRVLIHYVLRKRHFGPDEVIFPVSAAMLQNSRRYDESLEVFSEPSVALIDYDLDPQGRLSVNGETKDLYRCIDCTEMSEALFEFVQVTIEKELPSEIQFLRQYDQARILMQQVVDLPNRHADLLIRLVRQHSGRLSKGKRKLSEFEALTDDEITSLENAVSQAFAD